MKKVVGYVRVSTKKQKDSGLGVLRQVNEIKDYALKLGFSDYEIYVEDAVSGGLSLNKRQVLRKALQRLDSDTIFIVECRDRLARSTSVIEEIDKIIEDSSCMVIYTIENTDIYKELENKIKQINNKE